MTTEGCSAQICPSEEELRPWKILSIFVFTTIMTILWIGLSWRPVFPALDAVIARMLAGITGCLFSLMVVVDGRGDSRDVVGGLASLKQQCKDGCDWCFSNLGWIGKKARECQIWLRFNHAPEFFKIFLTYVQILGSFTMFSVDWPPALLKIIVLCKGIFKFDVLQLPGISCMWAGISFTAYLQTYTVVPLACCGGLALPLLVAWLKGMRSNSKLRWRRTLDHFWRNTVFLMFCVYPTVSLASMLALNCDSQIGRLKNDYRVICPDLTSFTYLYSVFFILLYPIGIPVVMNLAMRSQGIVNIVKDKMDSAKFHAMLSLFMKDSTSVEAQRVARIVGSHGDDEDTFKTLTQKEFQRLCCIQGGGETIHVDALVQVAAQSHGVQGTTIEDLCKFFLMFDENGDGEVDLDEFRTMVKASYEATNLFMGSEVCCFVLSIP